MEINLLAIVISIVIVDNKALTWLWWVIIELCFFLPFNPVYLYDIPQMKCELPVNGLFSIGVDRWPESIVS